MAETAPAGAPARVELDELMLAMDVVDTLRHQEGLALKELGQDGRDAALKARLREIYAGQGLSVDDRVLDEGIRALKEARFAYTPPAPGLARTLARLWVARARVGIVAAVLVVLVAGGAGWLAFERSAADRAAEAARVEIAETLPRAFDGALAAATAEARDAAAKAAVTALAADGRAALARGDAAAARAAVAGLDDLRARLARSYELVIVSRPGERTGVFRIPDANEGARNYYVVVEAVDPDGGLVAVPVTSEEDGSRATVSKFAVRVPKATYDAVARDKADDGIVEDRVLGEKPRGSLATEWSKPVLDGAILSW